MNLPLFDGMFAAGVFDSAFTFPDIRVTPVRTVTCLELELFAENGGVTHLNGVPYKIKKGAIICARAGDKRYTELPIKAYYLKIDASSPICELFSDTAPYFIGTDTDGIITSIKELMIAPTEEPLQRYSLFLATVDRILSESKQSARLGQIPVKKSREAVGLAIEYMEEHFRESCSLKDVAAFAHFSPVYFHGIFRLATGKTPYEYLFSLRIEEAKRLLITESIGMSEIAERSGFTSQAYFNYSFKKATSLTPSEYRRRILNRYLSENGRF